MSFWRWLFRHREEMTKLEEDAALVDARERLRKLVKKAKKNGILADYIEAEKGIKGRP